MKLNTTQLPYMADTQALCYSLKSFGGLVALESTNIEHENGRWSVICSGPIDSYEVSGLTCNKTINQAINSLKNQLPSPHIDLPFAGGVIGIAGYDLQTSELKSAKRLPPDQTTPSLIANLYTWGFIIDHELKISTLVHWEPVSLVPQKLLIELFLTSLNPHEYKDQDFALTKPFKHYWEKLDYQTRFDQIINYIKTGDCYQINLTQQFKAAYKGSELSAYHRLKNQAKVPYACFFEHPSFCLASASPEQFLQCENNHITTKPIKGTQPRDDNPLIDKQNHQALRDSLKDQAENLMIVDLLRNDISKNASQVTVDKLFEIESFSTVHHLVSKISAALNPNTTPFQLFLDCFPGGSITGAPKIRAMQIISELEKQPRGFYCGSVFCYSANNIFRSNILIRTFTFKGGEIHCAAGGGITIDSQWESEYQESLDKISKLMSCLT